LIPISIKPKKEETYILIPNDTIKFSFKLPKPIKTKEPRYFKIVISENGLRHGLNSATIKLQ